jgi:hypothetical protein
MDSEVLGATRVVPQQQDHGPDLYRAEILVGDGSPEPRLFWGCLGTFESPEEAESALPGPKERPRYL